MEGRSVRHISIGVGMSMIERIDRIRELADFFGFRMGRDPHTKFTDNIDTIVLYPKDVSLPIYSRDACLFTGNINEVDNFLEGIRWARHYDMMLGATTDQRRKQYEDKEVARLAKVKYNKEKAETFKLIKQEHA